MTQKLTILFDLDGTLVDTAPDLMGAHNHVMKKFGYPQKSLDDIKHIAGRGAWIMMQRTFRDEIKDEIYRYICDPGQALCYKINS